MGAYGAGYFAILYVRSAAFFAGSNAPDDWLTVTAEIMNLEDSYFQFPSWREAMEGMHGQSGHLQNACGVVDCESVDIPSKFQIIACLSKAMRRVN